MSSTVGISFAASKAGVILTLDEPGRVTMVLTFNAAAVEDMINKLREHLGAALDLGHGK